MTTKADILNKARDLVALIEGWDEGEIQPPPPPASIKSFTVRAGGKALARYVYSHNAAGKPVMQIYPGDSITEGRIKYTEGQKLAVLPTLIRADGGDDYYEIASSPISGFKLYLRAVDGIVA